MENNGSGDAGDKGDDLHSYSAKGPDPWGDLYIPPNLDRRPALGPKGDSLDDLTP